MSNKKKLNKEIRRRYELEMEIKENPDDCFCGELLGKEANCNWDNPIGETPKEYYSPYDYKREHPYSCKIYKCNRCGKNFTHVPVIA